MKKKGIDLRTERGRRIYNEIAAWYPSLDYGWRAGKEYLVAEGYCYIIDSDGVCHVL